MLLIIIEIIRLFWISLMSLFAEASEKKNRILKFNRSFTILARFVYEMMRYFSLLRAFLFMAVKFIKNHEYD